MSVRKAISNYTDYVLCTDEESLPFWQKMSYLYAVYGADYTAAGLRHEYKKLCKEEERQLIAEAGCHIPEIKLEKVFTRLLIEAENRHKTSHTFGAGGTRSRSTYRTPSGCYQGTE